MTKWQRNAMVAAEHSWPIAVYNRQINMTPNRQMIRHTGMRTGGCWNGTPISRAWFS